MNMETLLYEVVENGLDELKGLEVGSDEYKSKVDVLTKLADRAIELKKIDVERLEKAKERNVERAFRQKQMDDERKDRRFKNWVSVGSIVLPLGVACYWTIISMIFEKEDTLTSSAGKKHLNWLLSIKK